MSVVVQFEKSAVVQAKINVSGDGSTIARIGNRMVRGTV